MKIIALVLTGVLMFAGAFAYADEATEKEVIKQIMDTNAYTKKNLKGVGDDIAKEGSLEFWSSGGLLNEVSPGGEPQKFDAISLNPKHIRVITLVPGEIAVAQYYSEGGLAPVGIAPVSNYRTRVTQVLVKQGGKWKTRAAHYSPITGGAGTSQTSIDD